jgi:hypothetical protein
MKLTLLFSLCAALCGCSVLSTTQTESPEGVRKTKTRALTFFDSKSELAKLKTTNTEKTQSVSVSGLTQESSGTNATALTEKIVGAAVSAAVKAVAP